MGNICDCILFNSKQKHMDSQGNTYYTLDKFKNMPIHETFNKLSKSYSEYKIKSIPSGVIDHNDPYEKTITIYYNDITDLVVNVIIFN